jgi:hypothetical protein
MAPFLLLWKSEPWNFMCANELLRRYLKPARLRSVCEVEPHLHRFIVAH